MRRVVLEAPSVFGLTPNGVQDLPAALLQAGLRESLGARHAGRIAAVAQYSPVRDPASAILNAAAVRDYAIALADAVGPLVDGLEFPVVLGGDCSIVLGTMLALRRRGRFGLLFLDGHTDFYAPEQSPTGEAADMDLALVTGRGPDIVANVEGLRPFVRERDTVAFGFRDEAEVAASGGNTLVGTAITPIPLAQVRKAGITRATELALKTLMRQESDGFWIHLDVDVLDDAVMPAVDYRMAGGLSFGEVSTVLSAAGVTGKARGLTVAIFNPRLDTTGALAHELVSCLVAGIGTD